MARILLLSSQPILGGDIIKSLLTKGDADLAKIDVVTNSASLGKGAMGSERYVAVFAFAEDQSTHSHTFLAEIQKSLAPGGAVTIVEKDHMDTQLLEKKLVMAGFMDCRTEVSPSGDAMIEARKPKWSQAASRPIKLQSGSLQPPSSNEIQSGSFKDLNGNATANDAQTQNAWSLAAGNLEDDDIVDEDDLLLDEDKTRPEAYDCGISTAKKACKDCTCGRAEGQKVEVKLTQDMLNNPQSSGCGSCGLGDAFRCGTCPYRGLPSFEMGKKIELPPDFLAVDI